MEKRRHALLLAYDGGAFRGFQRQPGMPTVQEALETALRPLGLTGRLDVAARTDAGVHALGQVVTFWARGAPEGAALRAAVNAATPPALLCVEAARVHPSTHARASARSRCYAYLVGTPVPEVLAGRAWSLPDERAFPGLAEPRLDAGAVAAALRLAVGEHDFAGFARPGEQRDTVRTLLSAQVIPAEGQPLWAVVLRGRGFLRAMVRNLVGTAVAAGLGLLPPERISEILARPARYRGVRAPAWGLTLQGVEYEPPLFP
ncbi:MAG: tRNA pseudouridine(38-40) synthase TruA [Deltaproteobacteria bacterium]|nr:tRNA pseudouridine(38-40) synthase TruA [Deltaproteobacteria bacterium]